MNRIILLFLTLILVLLPRISVSQVYSYEAKHQSPQQLVAAMKPHLEPATKITVNQKQLLITASESDYKKIQQMLSMLDKALQNYLVEIKILNRRLDDWELNGNTPNSSTHSTKKITRYQTGSSQNNEKHFRLELMEGYRGFIETGETFQQSEIVQHYGKFVPKTTNKKLTNGFYLSINESSNNQVSVNVSASSENRTQKYASNSQSSAMNSQLLTNKNQWLLIATINADNQNSNSRQYSTNNPRSKKRFYYLRINDR